MLDKASPRLTSHLDQLQDRNMCSDYSEPHEPRDMNETEINSTGNSSTSDACLSRGSNLYQPLYRGQTRLVLILSKEDQDGPLFKIKLIRVELMIKTGAREADGATEWKYNALSHRWDNDGPRSEIDINGSTGIIPTSLLTLLKTLQLKEAVYPIWIDSICINQNDDQERASQVQSMLDIYKRAAAVVVWLGEEYDNSDLAMDHLAGLGHSRSSEPAFDDSSSDSSDSSSASSSRVHVYTNTEIAIIDLYARPYLGRTWIRQELYAAKSYRLYCGSKELRWRAYLFGEKVLRDFRNTLPAYAELQSKIDSSLALLREARANTEEKTRRGLLEVLLSSKEFDVALDVDTVFAVLGMCGVPTTTNRQGSKFLIDYSLSMEYVCNQIALRLLENPPRQTIGRMWHFYTRCQRHQKGLASFAMDWRSSRCSREEFDRIEDLLSHYVSRLRFCPYVNVIEDNEVSESDLSEMDDEERRSFPHKFQFAYSDFWSVEHHPTSTSERPVLVVRAHLLNYVAHLSNFTCSLNDFIKTSYGGFKLGKAGLGIHNLTAPEKDWGLFLERPEHLQQFEPHQHTRRIAILGTGLDQQVALVPASTKKGDIIVAIAANQLPFVFEPVDSDILVGSVYAKPDPYEDALQYSKTGHQSNHSHSSRQDAHAFDRHRKMVNKLHACIEKYEGHYRLQGPAFVRQSAAHYSKSKKRLEDWFEAVKGAVGAAEDEGFGDRRRLLVSHARTELERAKNPTVTLKVL